MYDIYAVTLTQQVFCARFRSLKLAVSKANQIMRVNANLGLECVIRDQEKREVYATRLLAGEHIESIVPDDDILYKNTEVKNERSE